MVLANELLDRYEGKISSLKQDLPELKPKDFATRLNQILENFQEMRESLQSVIQLFDGLDLEGISSQELLKWLFKKSHGAKEGVLMDAASSNNGLELSVQQDNYEYQGVLLPSRIKQMETIWKWLNNDRVGIIGITGEDEMGKRWMVMELMDRAIKAKLFDIVIVLDMYGKGTLDAQQYIVDQLGLSITKEPDGKYSNRDFNRAVALSLGKKKCLLILDDLQFVVDLSELGFSEPWKQNVSSKVLLSGPTYVMHRVEKDKICQVEPLDDDEALLLFLGRTGLDIDSPHVIEIARPLIATFKGLVKEIVWGEGYVLELTNGVCHLLNLGKMEVIQCLRSCCYLYTEDKDTNVKVKDLIAWWIMEILVADCLGLEEAYEKAQHILQELIDSEFLERNETHVWLMTQQVSRLKLDSFIGIIPPPEFNKKRSCVMNEKFKSKDSDDDERTTELLLIYGKESYLPRYIPADFFIHKMQTLHTLAILNAGIVSLPESLSNLKHLEVLIIKGCISLENLNPVRGLKKLERLCISGASRLREIPDDIFQNIHKLVELHLSNTQLKQLPLSFSNLANIKTLILQGCSQLTSIPDIWYSSLKTLDLSRTLIETFPSSSNLESLEQLFLRGCTKITTMQHPDGYHS